MRSSLWAVAVIMLAVVVGIVAALIAGAKDVASGLVSAATSVAVSLGALAVNRAKANRNDKDAPP